MQGKNRQTPTQQLNLYVVVCMIQRQHIMLRNDHRREHTKVEYIEYTKNGMYFVKQGDKKPLSDNGDWAGYNNEPSPQGRLGHVYHAR